MICNGKIKDFAKGWTKRGDSWHCSAYCFCNQCEFREIVEGLDIQSWISIEKIGFITESGIFNIKENSDILFDGYLC